MPRSIPAFIAAITTLVAAALALAAFAGSGDSDQPLLLSGALALFAIGLYCTGVVPGYVTALLFFLLAMLLSVAPADVVFSGFRSPAFWLVFGGLIIGLAVKQTGLGNRAARALAVVLHGSYLRVIAGTVMMTVAVSFVMPSSLGRVVLLIPIVLALADELGYVPGRQGRTGMVAAAMLGIFLPAFTILPANIPNMIMLGAAEALYGIRLGYMDYLLIHFPTIGLGKVLGVIAVTVWLFPDSGPARPAKQDRTAMSAAEKRLAVLLAIAVALWMGDTWHGISPAWIGLGAGLLCLMPGIGVVTFRAFEQEVDHTAAFYVAGIISLGAVIAHGGLGDWLGQHLLDGAGMAPGNGLANLYTLSATASLLGLATTLPGVPAVLTPLAALLSEATGFSREAVVMSQVIGFSTVLLPYQAPPLVVAIRLGGLRAADITRCTLALALYSFVVLVPLTYLWWQAIDLI
ncbi:MAG: SLC13 family permease [Alphaproteobacteria bacterium]|nr:SLC13 family permease [Alphaproteobacteria bacterium]